MWIAVFNNLPEMILGTAWSGVVLTATLISEHLARPYACGNRCPKRAGWCGG